MMKRLFVLFIFVCVAAGVAYLWVGPDALDEIGVTPAVTPIDTAPVKDTSRVGAPPPVSVAPAPGAAGTLPVLGILDLEDLPFEAGCGMSLTRAGEDGVVFVDAVPGEGNGTMVAAMVLDGGLVVFDRTQADGDPMEFGQYPRQIFISADQQVTAVVEIELGEPLGPGDIPVASSTLTVMKAGLLTLQFPAAGRAGC